MATDPFLQKLRQTFKSEAEDLLREIHQSLAQLEKSSSPSVTGDAIEKIYRLTHTLKGAARSVSAHEIESLCQLLEDLFAALKTASLPPAAPHLDSLHHVFHAIEDSVHTGDLDAPPNPALRSQLRQLQETLHPGTPPSPPPPTPEPSHQKADPAPDLDSSLAPPDSSAPEPSPPPPSSPPAPSPETLRLPVHRVDQLLYQADEITVHSRALQQQLSLLLQWRDQIKKEQRSPDAAHPGWTSALEELNSLLRQCQRSIQAQEADMHLFKSYAQELLLLPLATVFEPFHRTVRELSRSQNKEVELTIEGAGQEVDRRLLPDLREIFLHLLRNAVDHGVESLNSRQQAGKPSRARLHLSVTQVASGQIHITLEDDGAGIDPERLRNSIVRSNLLTSAQAASLPPDQLYPFLFRSGFSTEPVVSAISGRGLGLAIVRDKLEDLGGQINIHSTPGIGSRFQLEIPIRKARYRVILVRAGQQLFALPTHHVNRVFRPHPGEIRLVNGQPTTRLDDRNVPLSSLSSLLGLADQPDAADQARPALHIAWGGAQAGLIIDEISGEEEVLVREFTKPLVRLRYLLAATLLTDGQLVPILNVAQLLDATAQNVPRRQQPSGPTKPAPERPRILVAEDSLTSRTLLRTILESNNYSVTTAVDGAAAWDLLQNESFALLVSDVEMPHLDGISLTSKIRADRHLSGLPVVLISALGSQQDQERGIDAGADAYLVKSRFDQSDLLHMVKQLL